jgi:hypothetical protein
MSAGREDDTGRTAKGKSKPRGEGPAPLPEKLVAELTAHRTMALRSALGEDPRHGADGRGSCAGMRGVFPAF